MTPASCFGFGAIVNFVGIPFALPYFAVVDQVLVTNLSPADSLTVLTINNIGDAVPFVVVPVAVATSGKHARSFLEKISGFLGKLSDITIPWVFGLLGLALTADSAV